ncbi:MAG: hypothetical protein LBU48_02485 [Coriobacteriales bacterium]|nr:hypothetical protein [Coriobacteriales bacterium]
MVENNELERLYQAISWRKSVRKYRPEPLAPEVLQEVRRVACATTALDDSLAVAFSVVSPHQIKGLVSAKSPHYLALYAKGGLESLTNAAFRLQQMDLWFSAQGYGSCWLGMPNMTQELAACDGLPFVVMLAFGAPAEEAKRGSLAEFKRKALPAISTLPEADGLLEALRLAPSASNRQPWKVTGDATTLRLHIKQDGFVGKRLFGAMRYSDAGIALCHLWLSAVHAGTFAAINREVSPPDTPEGYDYFYSVALEP